MNHINKQIKNTLKVILSVMMIFSSILVVNPTPVISEETTEEEKTEIVEQVVETNEELPTEIVEEVKQEVEKEDEEVETVEQKPLLMTGSLLGETKTYKVTIKNGLIPLKTLNIQAGSTINQELVKDITYTGGSSGTKAAVFYYRVGGLILYKEYEWNFSNMTVDKDLTLYVKFKDIGTDGDFDFRVKHEQSNVFTEFNTGSYTNVESGYTYSYYNYQTNVPFSYVEDTSNPDYVGTSFDLAIQESNPGDTIELLKNIEIREPISIWSDINLDLNEHAITYTHHDTIIDLIKKIINFFWRLLGHSTPIIPVNTELNPAIFVYNARTTISNGTIKNTATGSGDGILVYSDISDYVAKLDDLVIEPKSSANAVAAGYEGTYTDDKGLTTSRNAKGNIVIESGSYKGSIKNYNKAEGGSITINGGFYINNPIDNTDAVLGKNRYLYNNQLDDTYKFRVGDYVAKAVIVDSNGVQISNETLESALESVQNDQTIKLVEDISLTSNLVINAAGKHFDIDTNGHNITAANNSVEISIEDSGSGEVMFKNSNTEYTGFVDVPINAKNNSIVIIESGYYASVAGNNAKAIGGYFVSDVSSCVDTTAYTCNPLDKPLLNKYNYNVVKNDELYVAKIGDVSYTTLTAAITAAQTSDTITVLKNINLADTITINKSLTISLPSGININSYALNSFVVEENATVNFIGANMNTNSIANKALANGNKVVAFNVKSNAKLIVKGLNISVETQNCGDKELIGVNITGNNGTLELNASKISFVGNNSANNKIIAINISKNVVNSEVNLTNFAMIDMTPCNNCLEVVGINNNGSQSTINISSSVINLKSINNQKDYIDYKGIDDNLSVANSNITLDKTMITVTNNQGNSFGVIINSCSSLNIKNSSTLSMTVRYDRISNHMQKAISSAGNVTINDSTVNATSYSGNITGLDVASGTATLENVTMSINSPGVGNCLSNSGEKIRIKGNSYLYSSNNGQVVNCSNGTVEISGGHFSDDITEWLARNYKCTYNPTTPVPDGYTYNYAVDYSYCGLGVTVANDGTLVINYKITFDPIMLKNPDDYGVRFISNTLSEYNDVVFSITDTKNEKSDTSKGFKSKFEASEGRGVYSFNIAARLMDANVGVEIINIKKDHVYHRKNAYSVKDYYYAILESKNPDGSYVYSATMRDLAAAALNYGAYCQETLNNIIESSMLVNANLGNYKNEEGVNYSKETSDAYNDEINDIGESKKATGSLAEKFIFAGHSLVLRASTTLRFRFKIEGSSSVNGYEAYYRNLSNNETEFTKVIPQEDGETYYIDIPGIKSYNLNNNFELKIVKGSDSCIVTYGPLNYIYKQFVEATEKSLKLAKVLYAYYKSASIYYGD